MTPADVLAGIPHDLLQRHPAGHQVRNATALAKWLLERGHRPSLLEIEQERVRRTPTNHREANRQRDSTSKEN